jgi:hypothetical protein
LSEELRKALAKPPHRVVDEILDTVASIPPSVSETISGALDKLPLGKAGPHRALDAIVKGVGEAVKSLGEGLASALDTPLRVVRE